MKLLKQDLKDLLDQIHDRTQTYKYTRVDHLPNDEVEGELWRHPALHEINSQFAQDIVMLVSEYHQAIEKSKQKAYHNAGYFQVFKGRNPHTKLWSK